MIKWILILCGVVLCQDVEYWTVRGAVNDVSDTNYHYLLGDSVEYVYTMNWENNSGSVNGHLLSEPDESDTVHFEFGTSGTSFGINYLVRGVYTLRINAVINNYQADRVEGSVIEIRETIDRGIGENSTRVSVLGNLVSIDKAVGVKVRRINRVSRANWKNLYNVKGQLR